MSKLLRTFALLLATACGYGEVVHRTPSAPKPIRASYYAPKFEGRLMANGQPFHSDVISAASLAFPLGTVVRVTNKRTGKSVVMVITDRGPWNTRFDLDLSMAAFTALGFDPKSGWGWVTVRRES